MKNLSRSAALLFFLLLISSGIFAQQMINDLVVFANDGEAFTLIMNGEKYNEVPQTNVKVRGLTLEKYEVTLIFSNKKMKTHTTTVTFLGNGNECVFALNRHGKSHTMDYLSSKPVYNVNNNSTSVNNYNNNYNNTSNNTSSGYNNTTGTYSNSTYSNTSTNTNTTYSNTYPSNTGTSYNYGTGTNSTYSNTNSSIYPNSNTSGVSIHGSLVNVGVNSNGGISVGTKEGNVNLNAKNGSGGVSITEFGQTITLNKAAHSGCSNPMNELQFEKIKNSVSSQTSDSTKLIAAKTYLTGNCFKTYQIKELDTLFTEDETKLDFVKNAYLHTSDLNNYHELKSHFNKDANKEEFQKFIHRMRQ